MRTHNYRCTVTEPLILVKKEKTEQSTEALDYIPGNTFRGIVAANLFSTAEDKDIIDAIIFNGTVQFGDAHIIIDGKRAFHVPTTFYKNTKEPSKEEPSKEEPPKILNFHKVKPNEFAELKKPKQIRKGYFIEEDKKIIMKKVAVGDRMKSSRESSRRSSEKTGLFIYRCIQKGQEFEFSIRSKDDKHLETVKKILDGTTKYFGKSKGAEFGGAIKIKWSKETEVTNTLNKGNILYAESNLCFLNAYGEFTATPSPMQLTGNPDLKIDWKRSQVRYRTYMPYNFHRQNWDAERLIIEKGSVFVILNKDGTDASLDSSQFKNDIGCFLTEGYGRVLISPDFLNEKELDIVSPTKKDQVEEETLELREAHKPLITYLKNKALQISRENPVNTCIDTIISEKHFNPEISPTQWSNVFKATITCKDISTLTSRLFSDEKALLTTGVYRWDEKDTNMLKKFIDNKIIESDQKIGAVRLLAKKMRLYLKNQKTETL